MHNGRELRVSPGKTMATICPVLAATVPRYGRPTIRALNHEWPDCPCESLKTSTGVGSGGA